MGYFDKIERFGKLMICFCHFHKKKKKMLALGVAHTDPFLSKLGPKMAIFRGFSKKISELLDSN